MSVNRDLVQLKLQQRILKDKLSLSEAQIATLSADELITTKSGNTVSEFRIKSPTRKLPPLQRRDVEIVSPAPVKNEKILTIRLNHLQRTVCKKEITDLIKEKEKKELEKKQKHRRRAYPSISIPPSLLPNRYLRGELPCTIEHGANGHFLSWACPLENLDYEYYLPIFFDGLQCKEQPISFLARQGIEDMLFAARGHQLKVISCVKSIVRPLRNALGKFDTEILLGVLKAIQQLLKVGKGVGAELLPHSKQFLAPMAAFLECNKNIGDSIDYAQRQRNDVGEEVMMTLEMMEEYGGPRAFESIKFCIPLCKSFCC